jgi:hypothetical protein
MTGRDGIGLNDFEKEFIGRMAWIVWVVNIGAISTR